VPGHSFLGEGAPAGSVNLGLRAIVVSLRVRHWCDAGVCSCCNQSMPHGSMLAPAELLRSQPDDQCLSQEIESTNSALAVRLTSYHFVYFIVVSWQVIAHARSQHMCRNPHAVTASTTYCWCGRTHAAAHLSIWGAA
jgi:hypothetical protein